MNILKAILLGILQGITEFLPVSSSGHLVVFNASEDSFGLFTVVMLHLGTLLAILVYYRRDIVSLAKASLRLASASARALTKKESLRDFLRADASARLALIIIVATVPTGLIGLLLKSQVEKFISPGHARIVGLFFIVTAVLVYFADRFPVGLKGLGAGRFADALVVGIFQGIAVIPGLSRSGLTIFAAVSRGFERHDAARLSFLVAVPAMLGAVILEIPKGSPTGDLTPALVGAAAAFVSGYISLVVLIRILASRKLRYFAGYLLALGACVLIWAK